MEESDANLLERRRDWVRTIQPTFEPVTKQGRATDQCATWGTARGSAALL